MRYTALRGRLMRHRAALALFRGISHWQVEVDFVNKILDRTTLVAPVDRADPRLLPCTIQQTDDGSVERGMAEGHEESRGGRFAPSLPTFSSVGGSSRVETSSPKSMA